MGIININGKQYSGRTITITNGRIIVNGETDITPDDDKEIRILIEGGIDILTVDACDELGINGNVGELKTMTANIKINGNVSGNIITMSGNVTCLDVSGNVKTMSGDVHYNK